MPSQTDLMGLGMPPLLAQKLGYQPEAITCAGTSSGTAAAIHSKMVKLVAASSQTGAILPVAAPGDWFFISCDHATTASAVVYPPAGATITNASSVTLAQDKNMIVWQYSPTLWYHVILA